ncbi:thioredoxin-like domain-containing protein [Polyangium aurulentum]|uniref:thioredoxin-like domain-containing protein n=1 Tax=Polyangium aurulentum TaxID=2567896 RepID=UPI0010ADF956|nr:thioredoxin-like domain-containing protein [Polyangium aurulentum]UQA62166.1 redoxin family protein [Polyangium aurulentum]
MRRYAYALALVLAAGCGRANRAPSDASPLSTAENASASKGDAKAAGSPLVAPDERPDIPGFNGATAWLNVDHPLSADELRGRVVLVDFWTSCCINCMHALPTLAAIEHRFRDEPFVVIGVHSPKFDEERDPARLRDVLADLAVEHPVAVDAEMLIWNTWGVRGWPTFALVDAEGRVAWAASGEPDAEELSTLIESALSEARASKKLAKGPLRGLRPERGPAGPLRYPGKVTALADGGLAIADTGHHRIVLTDKAGSVTAVIGSGAAGANDGPYASASFRRPEGMTEVDGDLYVADTGNHLLRKIDKKTREVSTVAGTGSIGTEPLRNDERPARSVALRSPWDVLHHRGSVYVALAGSHQIGVFDPKRGTMRRHAGSGREARIDGAAPDAAFAQPSALATDGRALYVLDSETSSVRAIQFDTGSVRTVIGEDLFVFGDADGDASKARLQHPIGMAYGAGALWVADSYNGKVKRVDPATGTTRTVLSGLGEPAGMAVVGADLVVADTNHHRLVRRPAAASGDASPVALAGLTPPAPPPRVNEAPKGPVVALGRVRAPARAPSTVHLDWKLPPGTGLNDEAPLRIVWTEAEGLTRPPEPLRTTGAKVKGGVDIAIQPSEGASSASLTGSLDAVLCDDVDHRVCVPVQRTLKLEIAFEGGAPLARAAVPLPPAR